jgi:diketogulonate reductase-like aldo/keto reductase
MEKRRFGFTNWDVPVIGQGTWYTGHDRRADAVAALRRGLDLGMTHIDTAEMYLSGKAEEWVAEAVGSRRNEVFLVSKVLPGNASRQGTVAACEGSLRRLRTGHLDCYLLHWRTDDYPLSETVEAFEQLRQQGKILSWGVSNFDGADLDEVYRPGEGPVCNQVLYHLRERAAEHVVLPWCEKRRTAFVAYSPFGHDDFPDPKTPGGRLLQEIAAECGGTPRQVALRFLLRWQGSFVIPKASNPRHLEENAGAGDLALEEPQLARLEQAFARGPRPRSLPML